MERGSAIVNNDKCGGAIRPFAGVSYGFRMSMTRRAEIFFHFPPAAAVIAAPADPSGVSAAVIARVPTPPWIATCGRKERDAGPPMRAVADDEYLQYLAGTVSGVIELMTAALIHPASKHHNENELKWRVSVLLRGVSGAQPES